jgi:glutaminyl-tRNA synthetase
VAVQFERQGYFCADPVSTPDRPVFNRTVGLRDAWAKAQKKGGGQQKKKNKGKPGRRDPERG